MQYYRRDRDTYWQPPRRETWSLRLGLECQRCVQLRLDLLSAQTDLFSKTKPE